MSSRRSRRKKITQVELFRELSNNGQIRVREKVKPWGASWREKVLIFFTALVFTANVWGFGGTSWWLPTVVTFYAGLAAVVWLFIPLPAGWDYDIDYHRTTPGANIKRLASFTPLYPGLALLAYIAISALNPSAQMWTDGQRFWFTPLQHIYWLPAGLKTPFEDMNAWRIFMLYAGPFAFFCALCCGVHHRRSLNILLYTIIANAVPLAVYGGWFRSQDYYAGIMKIYGAINYQRFDFPYVWTVRPFGPILGPNIAAGFLNLGIAGTMALLTPQFTMKGWWDHRKLAGVLILVLALAALTAGLILTASKSGLLICSALFAFWGGVLFIRTVATSARKGLGLVAGAAVILAVLGSLYYAKGNIHRILPRYSAMRVAEMENVTESGSVKSRMYFYKRTWEMFLDKPVLGHGAGSYRYAIKRYFNRALLETDDSAEEPKFGRVNYAHSDYLQLLAELGIIGAAITAVFLLAIAVRLLRTKPWRNPAVIMLVAGIGTVAVHAVVDFPTATVLGLLTLAVVGGRVIFNENVHISI